MTGDSEAIRDHERLEPEAIMALLSGQRVPLYLSDGTYVVLHPPKSVPVKTKLKSYLNWLFFWK